MAAEQITLRISENDDYIYHRYYLANKLHRTDGPAAIIYDIDMQKIKECWYVHGQLHRHNGPAVTYYNCNKIMQQRWYQHGNLHRDDGPAIIEYYNKIKPKTAASYDLEDTASAYFGDWVDNKTLPICNNWTKFMLAHRSLYSAIVYVDENKRCRKRICYYVHNKLHAVGQPAVIEWFADESYQGEAWYKNNKLHRKNGPATVNIYNEYEGMSIGYYINGQAHRDDGPAEIEAGYEYGTCHQAWIEHGILLKYTDYFDYAEEPVITLCNKC